MGNTGVAVTRSRCDLPRVLLVIDTLEVGGAERSLLAIAQRFRKVDATVCQVYEGSALGPEFEEAGIRVVTLGVAGKWSLLTAAWRLGRLVREERPSLLHSVLFRASVAARLAGLAHRLPVIGSFVSEPYSQDGARHMTPAARLRHRGVWVLDRLTARLTGRFVAVSQVVGRSNARSLGIDFSRVVVIPRGRDASSFSTELREDVSALRSDLALGEGPVLLNVGRLRETKGQMELIHALARILETWPDSSLLIAGEGPFRESLETEARRLGVAARCRLLGNRADIPSLLALATVFVFPSHLEGFPGALVEAMLAARPIVAADTPVHREVLGDVGVLFPAGDHVAMASAVENLLSAPEVAREMGIRGRVRALEQFDIDEVARRHEDLYLAAIDAR